MSFNLFSGLPSGAGVSVVGSDITSGGEINGNLDVVTGDVSVQSGNTTIGSATRQSDVQTTYQVDDATYSTGIDYSETGRPWKVARTGTLGTSDRLVITDTNVDIPTGTFTVGGAPVGGGGGTGDVSFTTGGTVADNQLTRFDGATGTSIQGLPTGISLTHSDTGKLASKVQGDGLTDNPDISLKRSRAANGDVSSTDILGRVVFEGTETGADSEGAYIQSDASTNWTATDHGTNLRLLTVRDGTTTIEERVRIQGSGSNLFFTTGFGTHQFNGGDVSVSQNVNVNGGTVDIGSGTLNSDARVIYETNEEQYTTGIDNSDGTTNDRPWKLSNGTALGTNDKIIVNNAGVEIPVLTVGGQTVVGGGATGDVTTGAGNEPVLDNTVTRYDGLTGDLIQAGYTAGCEPTFTDTGSVTIRRRGTAANNSPNITILRSNDGNANNQTTNGNRVHQTVYQGTDDTGSTQALGHVRVTCTEDTTAASHGCDYRIRTTAIGEGAPVDRIVVESSGAVTVPGNLTSGGTVNAANITGTGTVSGATVTSTGTVSGVTVTATGTVSGATVTSTGTVSGATVTSTGTVSGATVTATGDVTGNSINTSTLVNIADTPTLPTVGNTVGDLRRSGNTLYLWTGTLWSEFTSIDVPPIQPSIWPVVMTSNTAPPPFIVSSSALNQPANFPAFHVFDNELSNFAISAPVYSTDGGSPEINGRREGVSTGAPKLALNVPAGAYWVIDVGTNATQTVSTVQFAGRFVSTALEDPPVEVVICSSNDGVTWPSANFRTFSVSGMTAYSLCGDGTSTSTTLSPNFVLTPAITGRYFAVVCTKTRNSFNTCTMTACVFG